MEPEVKKLYKKHRHDEESSPYAQVRSSGVCLYRLFYSFLFFTRSRQPVLTGEIAERLPDFIREICERYEYDLIGHTIRPHQVHVVISVKPSVLPSDVVGNIKRGTAHHVFNTFPEMEVKLGKRSLWAEGYFVESLHWQHVETLVKSFAKPAVQLAPVPAERASANSPEKHLPASVTSAKPLSAQARGENTKPSRLSPEQIDGLLGYLLPTEQQVLTLLYGLQGERARPIEQVAIVLSLKPEEVKQIEEESIHKLKILAKEKPAKKLKLAVLKEGVQ
jgi:REP element-mobilizing transposase RayT